MIMSYFLTILILAGIAAAAAHSRTRSAQLARLAKLNGCAFVKEKETVTTPLSAQRLEFFTQFVHRFQNVFTYSDSKAYFRVADDNLHLDDNPKTALPITIFTAELREGQFPALKVAPLSLRMAPSQHALLKTNIPEIDGRYRLHAPTPASGILLTPLITGLLKTKNNMYLELNDNALVYHENTLIAPEDIETFRFRALQILTELEAITEKLGPKNTTFISPVAAAATEEAGDAEKRAEAMLKALCAPKNTDRQQGSRQSGLWIFIMLAALAGMSILSWLMLNRLPH